eukprot:SAG31_NODE_7471_length_1681_cov_1.331858_1_plen_153_part_10
MLRSVLCAQDAGHCGNSGNSGVLASSRWKYLQVGHVRAGKPLYNCSDISHAKPSPPGIPDGKTGGYGCRDGWHADALLEINDPQRGIPLVLQNTTQSIMLQLHVPRPPQGFPGNYSGLITVRGVARFAVPLPFHFTVPVAVEVWQIEIPKRAE